MSKRNHIVNVLGLKYMRCMLVATGASDGWAAAHSSNTDSIHLLLNTVCAIANLFFTFFFLIKSLFIEVSKHSSKC